MKKVLVAALVLTCCVSITTSRVKAQVDDHGQIIALEQQFATAVGSKNLGAIMKAYEPGTRCSSTT